MKHHGNATGTKRGWKKPLAARCKLILNWSLAGVPLDPDDDAFLRDLIERHPEAAQKIGAGISHFEVRRNEWNGRTFWLVRVDGTATDFSYVSCLTPPTPRTDFLKACRTAAVPSVIEAKNRIFDRVPSVNCPVSGEAITRETAHIDHAPPWTFKAISYAFEATLPELPGVEPTADGETVTRFADPSVADAFRAFHDERAVLRAVSRTANLSILNRKDQSP